MALLELEGKPDMDGNPRAVSGELMIGSGSQTTWRIAGQDLAARHFKIRANDDGTGSVAPASPANVVVVNGKQVPNSGMNISSGEVVAAGGARFIFLKNAAAPRPPAPKPAQE